MDQRLLAFYQQLKARGLTPEQERRIQTELDFAGSHELAPRELPRPRLDLYGWNDLAQLQGMGESRSHYSLHVRSLEDLLERDRQREKDGFPRKIRIGRMVRPGRGGKDKVVVVPTTVEEKLIHDRSFQEQQDEGGSAGGAGEGEQGEIIGEQKVREEAGGAPGAAGQGEGGAHEIESSAYDLGRILTEKFELPNLKEKGKKRSLTKISYELTDRNRGFGQVLEKKATLRRILQTNLALGNLPDPTNIDPTKFLIAPSDKVYRILSQEKDYDSQAMVFFVRDYSGSMAGKATELVVSQHVLIYSWLLYQYNEQVESRFILHDTEAREVPDFYNYYNSRVAGGTRVAAAYALVNQLVEKENLAKDYNIYVFHGTDGDDWDTGSAETVPQLTRMLTYANRVGVTITEHSSPPSRSSEVELTLKRSGLLESRPDLLRLDVMGEDAEEPRLIEGIRKLIS
ncbi:MAG: DUF444 family protein [Trichloromonadaceae bacterium]